MQDPETTRSNTIEAPPGRAITALPASWLRGRQRLIALAIIAAAEVVDEAAPDLVLEDARGGQVWLDDFKGRVVILDATNRCFGPSNTTGPAA